MNVVDSSAWLEYFADEPNADVFAPAVEDTAKLLVPSICLYEVFKRVFQQRGEDAALQAVATMMQGMVVDVDASLAICARLPCSFTYRWRTALYWPPRKCTAPLYGHKTPILTGFPACATSPRDLIPSWPPYDKAKK